MVIVRAVPFTFVALLAEVPTSRAAPDALVFGIERRERFVTAPEVRASFDGLVSRLRELGCTADTRIGDYLLTADARCAGIDATLAGSTERSGRFQSLVLSLGRPEMIEARYLGVHGRPRP